MAARLSPVSPTSSADESDGYEIPQRPENLINQSSAARRTPDKTEHLLQSHTWRALVGFCVPLILASYFVITWILYLRHPEFPNETVSFGRAGSRTVYYSWFILGVVGLDLSEYGLLGIEASMLMTYFWGAPNAWHVIMHGDHSWSGPDGWLEAVKSHFEDVSAKRRRTYSERAPRRLWWILAAPSILLFGALPLLGLSMELKSGFRETGKPPRLAGRNWTTFNDRSRQEILVAAHNAWSIAAPPRMPAFGMIFVNDEAISDNSILENFSPTDNVFPADRGVNDVFLAPQTDAPYSGKAWGIVMHYNCTIMTQLDDFVVLNRRNGSTPLREYRTAYDVGGDRIEIHNQTTSKSGGVNYKAIAELGFSNASRGDTDLNSWQSTQCYFNDSDGATQGYPGLTRNSTLEMAIWQTATDDIPPGTPSLGPGAFDFTLGPTIESLRGAYKTPSEDGKSMDPMEAIGVQCISSSAVGMADVDGTTLRYQNFIQSDTKIPEDPSQCVPRLELTVPQSIFIGEMMRSSWSEDFFTSANAQRLILTHLSNDSTEYALVRPSLLRAEDLRRALSRAYAMAAVQLMYDGPQGYAFKRLSNEDDPFTNRNATSYSSGSVLVRGAVPPALPATLLIIWAIISCILSIRYGFQRRWADTLDSFSMFRFGGDLSDEIKVKEMPLYSSKSFRDHEQLMELPGFVGDSRPEFEPGHVTLVKRLKPNAARRTKPFV
ncbi:hypothetical protein Q7P37_006926 [Cladosporium fusiforme]